MTTLRNERDCERYGFLNRCSLESDTTSDDLTFRVTPIGKWAPQTQSYLGGRDVRYVSVSALGLPNEAEERRATIDYGLEVAGTDLIYDVTGEFLQGKARPFECDLKPGSARIYAVLPFQLEIVSARVAQTAALERSPTVQVEFQQASGERIAGVLPFHLQLLRPDGEAEHQSWRATNGEGHLRESLAIAANAPQGRWSLVIRSQLNGQSQTLALEVD